MDTSEIRAKLDVAAGLDAMLLALGTSGAVAEGVGRITQTEADIMLVGAGRALAGSVAALMAYGLDSRWNLALTKSDPSDPVVVEVNARHEAAHCLVAVVAGFDILTASLVGPAPCSEVVLGPAATTILSVGPGTSRGQLALLRPAAFRLMAVLVAGGLGEALRDDRVPLGAGRDMMQALHVARTFYGEAADGALDEAIKAALTVLEVGRPALEKLATLLAVTSTVPGRVIEGSVRDELGSQFQTLPLVFRTPAE